MRKNVLSLLLAMGALTLSMASCSNDEPAGNTPEQDGIGIGYMAFTISSDQQGTRAVEVEVDKEAASGEIYNNGDVNEFAICPNNKANAAFFFDDLGNFYSMSNLQAFNDTGLDHGNHNNYAEKYYTYITRWRNTNANPVPTKAIVVLNANPDELNALAESLVAAGAEAVNIVRNRIYNTFDNSGNYVYGVYEYANEQYFTMSNSAFLDDSSADQTVTDITGCICETAEQALKTPATVYVERLLAKYQLYFGSALTELTGAEGYTFTPTTPDGEEVAMLNFVASYTGEDQTSLDYPTYTPKKWSVYIVNWGINGLEKKGRLIKNIAGNSGYFEGWNAYAYHRSFWGESPEYETADGFTTQYRPTIYDVDATKYADTYFGNSNYSAGDVDQKNTLHYVSFNDLKTRARYKYTAERTYNAPAGLTGYGPYRYASHYLIGAQLILDGVDTDLTTKNASNQLTGVTDKYYAYNFYWATAGDYIRYAYRRMATQVADGRTHTITLNNKTVTIAGVSDGYLYAKKENEDAYERIEVKDAANYFELQPAQVIHGDGKVALKATKTLYIKTGNNTYAELSEDQTTNMIYYFSEPAKHFAKGAMYYAVPVQHKLGKSKGTMAEINKDSGRYVVGNFGTVRNHWYRLTISTIGSVGSPVDNPDQPIIPDPEDEYYVALEIVILPWHVIDNGSVDL